MTQTDDARGRAALETETALDAYRDLDAWPRADLLSALVAGHAIALAAAKAALPALTAALEATLPRIEGGGRLVCAGAGTSGRLAMLDAAELGPTFGWPKERAFALLAGGEGAIVQAREGAEDEAAEGGAAVARAELGPADVLIAIAASGRTPFTLAAARQAMARGALVVGIANNPDTPLLSACDGPVLLRTGPEVLAGSTRLAAGTAQKIALNTFSTGLMIALGRTAGGRMVAMRATNAKLRERARTMLVELTGCDESAAGAALEACGYDLVRALRAVEGPTAS